MSQKIITELRPSSKTSLNPIPSIILKLQPRSENFREFINIISEERSYIFRVININIGWIYMKKLYDNYTKI